MRTSKRMGTTRLLLGLVLSANMEPEKTTLGQDKDSIRISNPLRNPIYLTIIINLTNITRPTPMLTSKASIITTPTQPISQIVEVATPAEVEAVTLFAGDIIPKPETTLREDHNKSLRTKEAGRAIEEEGEGIEAAVDTGMEVAMVTVAAAVAVVVGMEQVAIIITTIITNP